MIAILAAQCQAYERGLAYRQGSPNQRVLRLLAAREHLGGGAFPISIRQLDLAALLDLRPETLSRTLADLRRSGVLSRKPGLFPNHPERLLALSSESRNYSTSDRSR
jgi:CRP-like cAMP-binding protein